MLHVIVYRDVVLFQNGVIVLHLRFYYLTIDDNASCNLQLDEFNYMCSH